VFSYPLTAGLKPTSNGETTAQRGMINNVPTNVVLRKFESFAHASGADNTFDTLALQSIQWRHIVVPGGGIDCIQQSKACAQDSMHRNSDVHR
jgi:hypothetical protein